MTILLLTSSHDGTMDQLLSLEPNLPVFRFNSDLWRDYLCNVEPTSWALEDPAGRRLERKECSGVYFRKPFPHVRGVARGTDLEEAWAISQVQALVHYWVAWARNDDRLFLVDPVDESVVSKFVQLDVARRHFAIPETSVSWGVENRFTSSKSPIVVKSLAPAGLDEGRFMFTRSVDPGTLGKEWPWFLQEAHDGHDVTVLYFEGECFAASLDRSQFEGEDWRRHISVESPLPWADHRLSESETAQVIALMADLHLSFGRLDFIREPSGRLVFLEVNTNGEWGWLDDGRRGIFAKLAHRLRDFAADQERPHDGGWCPKMSDDRYSNVRGQDAGGRNP
jgi:hypothetical protein